MDDDKRIRKDDFELLDAWASGSDAAARELIQRHMHALFRFFERKVNGPVDDLMQDTLVACVEGRHRFRREAGFRSYLFGIARNVLFVHLRDRNREYGELDLDSNCLQDLGPTPSEVVARRNEEQLLLDALRRLPVETQVLLELYHWQQLTGPELAGLYGVREKTVRSRLSRAKDALRIVVAGLAESPALVHSTWADFESWARSLPKLVEDDDTAGSPA